MSDAPTFFVPMVNSEDQETTYAELARRSLCVLPSRAKRIYSIGFRSNGERWTATVGHTLRGVRYRTVRRRGERLDLEERLSNPATVLAIFEGSPYMVAKDHRILRNVGSEWVSPFMAGEPTSVTYFAERPSPPGVLAGEGGQSDNPLGGNQR